MRAIGSDASQPKKGLARRHGRHATFQDVMIAGAGASGGIARLIELSESGALLSDFDARGLTVGSAVTLTLLDGTELDARVVRASDYTADYTAVEFDLYLLEAEDHLHFDHLGADAFRRISNFQSQRLIASTTRLKKA